MFIWLKHLLHYSDKCFFVEKVDNPCENCHIAFRGLIWGHSGDSVLTCWGAGLSSVTLVRERRVLLGMSRVLAMLTVRLVLAVGGVRGKVLLRVVGVVRCLTVVVVVVVAAAATATTCRTRRVLIGAGSPGLLAGITGHTHQTCRWGNIDKTLKYHSGWQQTRKQPKITKLMKKDKLDGWCECKVVIFPHIFTLTHVTDRQMGSQKLNFWQRPVCDLLLTLMYFMMSSWCL